MGEAHPAELQGRGELDAKTRGASCPAQPQVVLMGAGWPGGKDAPTSLPSQFPPSCRRLCGTVNSAAGKGGIWTQRRYLNGIGAKAPGYRNESRLKAAWLNNKMVFSRL